LNLMEEALENHKHGYFTYISGEDYPIKSVTHIQNFFSQQTTQNFMHIMHVEDAWNEQEYHSRIQYYKINLSNDRGDFMLLKPKKYSKAFKLLVKGTINFGMFLDLLKKRSFPYKLYAGSNWWSLNYETLVLISDFIQKNKKELFQFFKYVKCGDELFFQTIFMEMQKRNPALQNSTNLTYVNWAREGLLGGSPATFTQHDLEELLQQGENVLFARKFDSMYDPKILDLLDEHNKY